MAQDEKKNKKGSLKVRGERLQGRVVSTKSRDTAIIEMGRIRYIPKYRRWARERSHLAVHNPPEIGAQTGDLVEVGETRKISKTKSSVIMRVIEKGG
jgi:small subunit ribosomal protein S17